MSVGVPSVIPSTISVEAAAISIEPFVTSVEPGMIPFKKRTVVIEIDAVTIVPVPCRVSVERCVRIIGFVYDDGSGGIWIRRIAFFVSDRGGCGSAIDPGSRNSEVNMGTDVDLGITGGSNQACAYDHGRN
jgi:hypothetical protein